MNRACKIFFTACFSVDFQVRPHKYELFHMVCTNESPHNWIAILTGQDNPVYYEWSAFGYFVKRDIIANSDFKIHTPHTYARTENKM